MRESFNVGFRLGCFYRLRQNTRILPEEIYAELREPDLVCSGIDSPAMLIRFPFGNYPRKDLIPKDIQYCNDVILINGGVATDADFIRYLQEHECWESWLGGPGGRLTSAESYDRALPVPERRRPAHRVAVLKELRLVNSEDRLDEWIEWWRKFYKSDIERVKHLPREAIERITANYDQFQGSRFAVIRLIQRNRQIREDIYRKVKAQPNGRKEG